MNYTVDYSFQKGVFANPKIQAHTVSTCKYFTFVCIYYFTKAHMHPTVEFTAQNTSFQGFLKITSATANC